MPTFKHIVILIIAGFIWLTNTAKAQVQLMPAVNVLLTDGHTFGVASISGRYFPLSRLAAGINIRYISTSRLALPTLEADYFFNTMKTVRPFIGLEGGSFSQYSNNLVYITWGIAPKLGLQAKFSPQMGVQLEVSHPIAIHRVERLESRTGLLLGLGLNISLGRIGRETRYPN